MANIFDPYTPYKPNPNTPAGNQSWFGNGAQTAFNMNGTSNIQPAGATQFQTRANPTASMGTFVPSSPTNNTFQFNPLKPAAENPVYNSPSQQNSQPGNQYDFGSSIDALMKYMGNTAAPTMDQIQMDPGYKFREQQGLRALDASLAGKGHLDSSGYGQSVLDYSQGLASQEYQNAFNRYTDNQKMKLDNFRNAYDMSNTDRNFIAGRNDTGWNQNYQQGRADRSDYQYDTTTGLNQNQQNMDNWFKQMGDAQQADSGLAGTGFGSAKEAVDLVTNSASTLAQLGISQANIQSMQEMAQRGDNAGLMKSLFGLLGMGVGAFAGGPAGAAVGGQVGSGVAGLGVV